MLGRERIFVMQAAQYRFDAQHQAPADLMPGKLSRRSHAADGGSGTPGPSAMCGRVLVVMARPMMFRIDRKCDSDNGISQSRHSRRIVPITRSQIALAFGLCGGDLSAVSPSFVIDASKLLAKMLSRSWRRYR